MGCFSSIFFVTVVELFLITLSMLGIDSFFVTVLDATVAGFFCDIWVYKIGERGESVAAISFLVSVISLSVYYLLSIGAGHFLPFVLALVIDILRHTSLLMNNAECLFDFGQFG